MFKKIEAIINSDRISVIVRELTAIGIVGMTVEPVKGRGRSAGMQLQWRGDTYNVDLLPATRITIVISEENVEATVAAIRRVASSYSLRDGVIFISTVEQILRVSGEEGREAISYQGDMDKR